MATYTIKWGDTLDDIASRFGTSTSQLAADNSIANPNRIFAGDTITVPGGGGDGDGGGGSDLDDEEFAALAGFTVSFFKSDPELKEVWDEAKSEQWDPARILAAMRQTDWFEQHSEAERQAQLLKSSDPDEYDAQLEQQRAQVNQVANETGLSAGSGQVLDQIAKLAFTHQWSTQQIRERLADEGGVRKQIKQQRATGRVAEAERMMRSLTGDFGVEFSLRDRANMARRYAAGSLNESAIQANFAERAKSTYAAIADDIDAGRTTADVARPYMESMAQLWEINGADIDLKDEKIRKALTNRNSDNKPELPSVWQFENDLRQDRRWLGTNNARRSLLGTGYRALKDMGVVA